MNLSSENSGSVLKVTIGSIFGNLCLALIKLIAGVYGNSYALIADAIESSTDVFSSILVFFGLKYAQRPPDDNHPYGHGRIEPLLTFVVVTFLIISATVIAYESIVNIRTSHDAPESWTLIVLGLIIIWKEIFYRIVKRKGIQENSTVLVAEAWHHRSDAITSLLAFIGISVALYFGEGYESADDWAALIATSFILYNSFKIFRPALGELMDEQLYEDVIKKIRNESVSVEGIISTEKCFVRKVGNRLFVDLHAIVDGTISVKEGHDISHALKDHLLDKNIGIQDVLIHIEPS